MSKNQFESLWFLGNGLWLLIIGTQVPDGWFRIFVGVLCALSYLFAVIGRATSNKEGK